MYGWMGKIIKVNLSDQHISQESSQPYAEKYLGGRGIGTGIYAETVSPAIKAFDPENCMTFMTGPLVGTGVQGATQLSVVAKSPMTYPESYCYGSLGGFVGAELKKAGFDGFIIYGCASKPVYLWIHDGEAELRDASFLWGQNADRTGEMLRDIHGGKAHYIAIGVSGERKVRTALASASHDSTLSAGFGAVMGSKNLKGIVILGSGKIQVSDPDKLHELNRYTIHISKRVRLFMPPLIAATGHAHILEVIGKGACYKCGFECISGKYLYGKKLVGHRKCQSMQYYLPWRFGHEDEPMETVFKAPVMANDFGMESWEMESIVEWLYACYKEGALSEEDTGLPLSKIGTMDFLEKLLHMISYREGFGDILAEGMVRAAEKLPKKATALYSDFVAPIGKQEMWPPRMIPIMALLYPLEPRIHHMNLHEIGFNFAAFTFNRMEPGSTPMTVKLVHDIARTFWGSDEAGDWSTFDGKALACKMIQNRVYTKEMLGLCDFGWPIMYSYNTPDHLGDPKLIGSLYTAVTGRDSAEIDHYAERHYTQQRQILLREGRKVPEADYPRSLNFTTPLEDAGNFANFFVPGPGDTMVNMAGNKLDKGRYTQELKEFYRIRGWDQDNGIPLPETLASLDLNESKVI